MSAHHHDPREHPTPVPHPDNQDAETPREVGEGGVDELTLRRAHEDGYEWPSPWCAEFLKNLRLQPNVTTAARLAGITRQGAYKARDRDPVFAAVWKDALEQSVDVLAGVVHRMGTTGLPVVETRTKQKRMMIEGVMTVVEEETVTVETTMISPQAAMFLLRAHDPARYSEKRIVTGSGGGPVQHEIYRQPDAERVLALARIAVELADADEEARTIDHEGDPLELEDGAE